MKMPYGDQALFMRRETFKKLGGFLPLPIMEDFDLVRRARRLGRIVTLDAPVVASGRLWERQGTIRVTLVHQLLIAGYFVGMNSAQLSRWRRRLAVAGT